MPRPVPSLFATLAVALLVTSACGASPQTTPGPSVQAIKSKGEILIAVRSNLTGFGIVNPATYEVQGLDPDIGRQIATELGVKVRFVEPPDADRVAYLESGKADLVISAFTITQEREKRIDFSVPYYRAGQSLMVRRGSSVQSVGDLNGKKVCTGDGSSSAKTLKQVAPQATQVLFKRYADAAQALVAGTCEAVSTDDVILIGLIATTPDTELRGAPFTDEPLGIGVKKGRQDLVALVNGVLQKMKSDGRLKALYDRHIRPFTGRDVAVPF
jgi:aspartate/glutamate/glutamine transport system substrate-binding protein